MARSAIHSRLTEQVRWQRPTIRQGAVDQTQLRIADAPVGATPFSFMVIGDTDAGISPHANLSTFSAAFAEQLMQHLGESRFLLHTGDVTYPVGSYQNYLEGFLRPYRSLLSVLPESPSYRSESVVFNRPLLPVPGNHDYVESGSKLWQGVLRAVCDRLRHLGIDLGNYGGQGGEAYGQTFLDDLQKLLPHQLAAYLADNYSAVAPYQSNVPSGQTKSPTHCLNYRPGHFTRLPNRYYSLRYGGVDFFALDSNTWNTSPEANGFDQQQLSWLEQRLIMSWQKPDTVGRIIYLHHSPYTTESVRWQQPETLWVRRHLQTVLDRVDQRLKKPHRRPLVDLIISGHAHCLEHMQTAHTGHADSYTDWIVCGGSGAALRPQCKAGSDILGKVLGKGKHYTSVVARSQLYAGVHGRGREKQQFHSFLRIEVRPYQLQKLLVFPFVVNQSITGWQTEALKPISVGTSVTKPSVTTEKKVS